MSGGGLYWKKQTIDAHRGPATSYKGLSGALPPPPKDLLWVHDEKTREWRLEPTEQEVIVEAVAVDENTPSDFLEHKIQPTDTFQGICLRYKLTPTELRRANKMLGSNLKLGPKKLLIPLSNVKIANINSRSLTRKEKTALLVSKVSLITKNKLTHSEARAYLDMADWDVDCAIEDVNGDFDWSSAHPYLFVGCRA